MKRLLSLVAPISMLGTLNTFAAEQTPAKDFFPIMAWNTLSRDCPGDKLEQLETMKLAGFNIAGFLTIDELSLAEKVGIQAFVLDDRGHVYDWGKGVDPEVARKNVSSLIEEVKDHPSVFGYYVCDEPTQRDLQGVGVVTRIFRELDPKKWPYVNMLPNSADPHDIGENYEKFLNDFIEAADPNIISVDDYTLMAGIEEKNPGITARYYLNMKQMREAAAKKGIPFWNIILSMPHRSFVEPTLGNMARQVYTSLAYGAKGLSYFCYFTNHSEGSRLGPIDIHGDKTPTWDIVRSLNKDVHGLAPVLNKLTVKRNYFLGKVPIGSEAPPKDAWITNKNPDDPTANPDILVGEFLHENGARYAMLVNLNTKKAVHFHYDIGIAKGIEHVSPRDSVHYPHSPKYVIIGPGMGMLVKIVD